MIGRDDIMKLTLALYRVTNLFPPDEPLKYKIRERANNILATFITVDSNPGLKKSDLESLLRDIGTITAYFDLAQSQNWVDARNFLVLKAEYKKIQELLEVGEFDRETNSSKELPSQSVNSRQENNNGFIQDDDLSLRRKNIMDILGRKAPIRLIEMQRYFPETHQRTLRRDINQLISQSLVERYERGKLIYYRLI